MWLRRNLTWRPKNTLNVTGLLRERPRFCCISLLLFCLKAPPPTLQRFFSPCRCSQSSRWEPVRPLVSVTGGSWAASGARQLSAPVEHQLSVLPDRALDTSVTVLFHPSCLVDPHCFRTEDSNLSLFYLSKYTKVESVLTTKKHLQNKKLIKPESKIK